MPKENESFSEIVDVVFSDETRMPIPDKSYVQELLETPVPLENRIAHIIPYVEPTAEQLSSYMIGKRIGAERDWVATAAKRIGIQPVFKNTQEDAGEVYPPLSLELLDEEWQWYTAYEALDDNLSTRVIAEFMAKSSYWVMKYAQELGFPFSVERSSVGSRAYMYSKQVIPQLRHIILSHPPAEDWYTLTELEEVTGRKRSWLASNLGRVGVESELRWASIAERVSPHFPPNSPDVIKAIIEKAPSPAGDWLTVELMAKQLHKTRDWVNRHIEQHTGAGEIRIDDIGRMHMHYPPEVYAGLQIELELQPAQAGDWLTVNAMAQQLSRSYKWVSQRIDTYEDSGEIRIDSMGNLKMHYPQDVMQALREESEPEHGDYLSVDMITRRVGHSSAWIVKRLPFITIESVEMPGKDGQLRTFYEPSVVDALLSLPVDIFHRHAKSSKPADSIDEPVPSQRLERYSERLYNSRKAHGNLSAFLHDPAFTGTRLKEYGLNSIIAEVTEHCDQKTTDIVASYLLGVEVLEIAKIYNVKEDEVGKIIGEAAKQVAASYMAKSPRMSTYKR